MTSSLLKKSLIIASLGFVCVCVFLLYTHGLGCQNSSQLGWDSDAAVILLLVHLLPPTIKGRETGKFGATEAADHVVKFMKVYPGNPQLV